MEWSDDSPASSPMGEAMTAPTADPAPDAPPSAGVSPDNAGIVAQPALSNAAAPLPPTRPVLRAPQPPDSAALDNARRGIWVMNENQDGWVLLGADRKPVMRKDRSRVAFYLRDAARLAKELAPSNDMSPEALAKGETDPVPLAPLDSGYNRDWNPQAYKSWLADITKIAKLLAYDYVRFTEPQEAVRRAVSDILQNPTYVKERHIHAWAPGKYDIEAVKFVAATLRKRAVGPEVAEGETGAMPGAGATTLRGAQRGGGGPRDSGGVGANLLKTATTSDQENPVSGNPVVDNSKRMERLSFLDAMDHYAKGNGRPISIPLNSLDLSGVSASAFGNKIGGFKPFTLPGEDGITIGTISLTLIDGNTVRATQGFDTYNFDLKLKLESTKRDVMTTLGFLVNESYALGANSRFEAGPFGLPIPVTKGGKSYRIYLEGEAKIKP